MRAVPVAPAEQIAPVVCVGRVFDAATTARWLAAIDAHPAWRTRDDSAGAFNRHSSSLRLGAVASLDAEAIARALLRSEVGPFCRDRLGAALACDVDQCWVRRQYAPARYPPGHAPHSWHQDGALGFDFLRAQAPSVDDLLAMVTCWIALTACGEEAPGLEWVDVDCSALLVPSALSDSSVRHAHDDAMFRRHEMQPGDCLAFGGGVLHHTQVSASMTRDRTSLEIRLFAAERIPDRLRGDRFIALH